MLLLTLVLVMDLGGPIKILKTYENFPAKSDEYLTSPYAVDFTPQGELLIADSKTSRVHIWDKNGKYRKSFGRPGQGPGEMNFPSYLVATKDKIWIWDYYGHLYTFDHEGNYLATVTLNYVARVFAVLNDNLILVAYHKQEDATNNHVIVALIDAKGTQLEVLKDYINESYLKPREGYNQTEVKAFGPEVEIQRRGDSWFFGYSQDRTLYEVNATGKIVGKKMFELRTEKPTDADKAYFEELTYHVITGKTVELSSLKNLKHNFDYEKSYYTHFLFQGDKAIFALTPIGGKKGCGNGFHRASYYVQDWNTGKALHRGDYNFSKDSAIYYRNGRILGLMVDDKDEYQIMEIALKMNN